jgi:hypothetical protein
MSQQAVSADFISKFSCWNIYQKTEETKTKAARVTDKLVIRLIYKLKILGPLSNLKILQYDLQTPQRLDLKYKKVQLGPWFGLERYTENWANYQ